MKVLIVFTHPNANSFNHALLERISLGLNSAGHEVRVKNLYQEGFNPILSSDDLSQLHQGDIPESIAKEHDDLFWAEGLIFMYPLWWYAPPAMLKGWFDVVFNNKVAFEYTSSGLKGLLKHQKALVMLTAGAPEDYFKENNSLELTYRPITEGALKYCGINNVSHKIFFDVIGKTDEERAEMLSQTEEIGKNF